MFRSMRAAGSIIALFLGNALLHPPAAPASEGWEPVARGLEVGRLRSPRPSSIGDSMVTVVRVDPAHHDLRLLSSGLLGLGKNPTAPKWVRDHDVLGVINASMFRNDHRTSVGYMRDGPRLNNGRWNSDNAVFAAGPDDPSLPGVQIIDRRCQDLTALARHYRVLIQNIRMIDCAGRNVWAAHPRRWSTACVGMDGAGRVLLIHARSPWPTHDLVEILRTLPLGLTRLMYVEGAPKPRSS